MERCAIESCENTKINPLAWGGKYYCIEHYKQMLWDEFSLQYNNWKQGEPVHYDFKYILGRAYDEDFFENVSESELSKTDISDRGIYFVKTEDGCEFMTTRYFTHSPNIRDLYNKIDKWVVDIEAKTFTMASTRKLSKKDFDVYSQET